MQSILDEVKALIQANVKEVTLLGQNVNGYHDSSAESALAYPETIYMAANGFDNLYKSKARAAPGARFADLLDQVSLLSPELRVRFTSPHPKDFNDNVLQIVASRSNICKRYDYKHTNTHTHTHTHTHLLTHASKFPASFHFNKVCTCPCKVEARACS